MNITVFRWRNIWRGERLQYRDTTGALAEFLPSDKSRQQVSVKLEGLGRDEREGRSVNSVRPERNGTLCQASAPLLTVFAF